MAAAAPVYTIFTLPTVIPDKRSAVEFLQHWGILHNPRICVCNQPMNICFSGDRWKCYTQGCKKEFGLRTGTWLANSHVKFETVILFIFCWAEELTSIKFCKRHLNLSNKTVIDYNNFLREVCATDLLASPTRIGGPNTTVEIDESQFSRRKNNVGRPVVNAQWVFGGICRETGESFLYTVNRRDAATLLPIIQGAVHPRTTIISDQWAAYNRLNQLGFQHETVNHSINFVDPNTGAHTNGIEGHWRHAKQRSKRQYGTHRSMMDSYMCEWMWRQRNRDERCLFEKMLSDIAKYWPPS